MWLLNTETLRLEYRVSSLETEYAILSHTWDDDEVTFQDIQNLDIARTRKGFAKISCCREQARAYGIPYFWCDTCCIQKESSSELSESINSMYEWYSNARICYVYLSDLENYPFRGGKDVITQQLKKCRWFTRAWTLQELIASEIAIFFDKNWNSIGSKESMVDMLTIITGIEPAVMASAGHEKEMALRLTSVAARISWASNRNATRIEDEAYSLLGILDINMPLIYGEGSDAFVRLQKEVFIKSSDHSVMLWNPDLWRTNSVNWARSPSAFRHCGRITTLSLESLPGVEAELTNLGIRVTLPVLEAHNGDVSAILNCRYEDDFRGPIALPLQALYKSSSSGRDEEIHVLRSDLPLLDDNNVCRYPVISEKKIAQAAIRRIVLLNYDNRPPLDVLRSPVRTNFLLNASTLFSNTFKLCRVSPEHRFNWNTWILSWRNIDRAAVNQKADEASFTWTNGARNYFLNLRLHVDIRGNIRSRLYRWSGRVSGNETIDRPSTGFIKLSQSCGEHGHYHLEHGVITHKTRPVTMLDEVVHVINLGYEPELEEILSKSPHLVVQASQLKE